MKSGVTGQNLLDIVAETSLPWFHYALLPNSGSRCALRVRVGYQRKYRRLRRLLRRRDRPTINAFTNGCNT